MCAIQLRCILTIFLVIAVCCNCQSNSSSVSSSWAKLQISQDSFSSMKYGNFHIEIYEHINNQKATTTASEKKYFYSPIALLDHKSAISRLNRFTKQPEMRFRLEMWNDKVENEVVQHLIKIVGQEIQPNKVRVIPLEKVILTSKLPTADYLLSPVWTYYDKSKILRLSLSCYDQNVCDELAEELRSDPEQFHHFKLLYSLSSQTLFTKQATISFESVISGQMITNLLHKFGDKTDVFLTANDERKMLTETATNIRIDTFNDTEIASSDTETQIYNILKDLMITSRTTIKEQSDQMWDSVFWNEDNNRPDRTTKVLNEIFNKLDNEAQKKMTDMFEKSEKQSKITEQFSSMNRDMERRREEQFRHGNQTIDVVQSNSWAEVDGISSAISVEMVNDSNSSQRVEILKEDLEKLLQESRNHVQWDGQKFVPKPIQLSRINLDKFRDPQSFQDRKVRVRYMNAELSVPIKFVEQEELTVTDEWNHLKDELKDTIELLNTTAMNLVKMNTELGIVKIELNNTRTHLANRLEETIQELANTRFDLNKTLDDISTEGNANSQRLDHELKVTEENLRKELKTSLNHLDTARINLNATRMELGSAKSAFLDFTTKTNANSQRIGHELKVVEDNMRKELKSTLNNLETATTNFTSIRTELSNTKSAVADLTTKLNARTSDPVDIGKMPTSCTDLQRMGHKLSGFFSIKGLKKMEMIYCDFNPNQNDKQKWIGYADVKSVPVHFYVQRSSSFSSTSTPILFEFTRVNEGNAMNVTSGKFTAPRLGTYFFSFTGLVKFGSSSSRVQFSFYLNGSQIGKGWLEENNTGENPNDQVTLQSTLNLKKGDLVWIQIDSTSSGAYLSDDSNRYTHFTGFMLEEEIVATL